MLLKNLHIYCFMKLNIKYIITIIFIITNISCEERKIDWLPYDYKTVKVDTTILIPTTSYRLNIFQVEKGTTLNELKGYPHFNYLGRKKLLFWSDIDSIKSSKKDSIIQFITGYIGDSIIDTKETFLISGYYSHTNMPGKKNYMEFTEMMIISNKKKKIFFIQWEF